MERMLRIWRRMLVAKGHDVTLFTINPGDLMTSEVQGVEIHRPRIIDMLERSRSRLQMISEAWGTGLKFFADVFAYHLLSATKFVNDACDVAWGLGSLLDDMDEAVLMGKRARKLVERQFTWDKVADSTIDVYEDVVASCG